MADRTISYEFRGKFSNLTAGLTAASKSVGDFGTKLTAADKQGQKMRAGLTTVGSAAGRMGLVAAGGLAAVVAVTARFEKAMSAVQAATHETAANMDLLREAAVKAGADTAYSASEAAGAIEELAKAGVSTADILGGGLSGALDLAAAGALDVSKAAEISATAMTQFKLEGSDVVHIADLLAAGAGKAQGSVEDLGMALGQSGLVASQVGLTIEETTGGLAAFASAGLLGSDAGTSFKTMLGALTPNSKEAATLMSQLGINAYDAQGQFVGLTQFAGNLRSALEGMTDQQRQSTLETIFGSDAVRAASVLYDQGADGIQSWITKTNDAGYAAETASTRLDNLAGDFEKLKGSLETALIGAGSSSQGPLRKLVQGLTSAVDAFNRMPPAAQSTVTALAGITAITGGAAWFGSKVINGIATTKQSLDDLGISAGKSRAALQAIGKGVELAIVVEGVKQLDDALAGLTDARLEGDLNRNLSALANGDIVGNLDNMGKYIRSVNSSIAEGTDTVFGWLPGKTEFSEASDEIKKVDEALASMVESGNGQEAAKIFEQIAKQSKDEGIGIGETTKVFDQYQLALKNTSTSADEAGQSSGALSAATDSVESAMGGASDTAQEYLAAQKEAAEALKESRDAARDTAGAFFNLGDGLNDSEVSLGDWIGQLEKQAAALRDFRKNAESAANKGLRQGLIAALQEAGPEGAMRLQQLANASQSEIGRANRAWKTGQAEINRYTDAVTKVPGSKSTDIKVNGVTPAISAVQALKSLVENLRDRVINIRVNKSTNANLGEAQTLGKRRATGGYVAGPGSGTSDSIPAYLSNGEYVMRASAVQKYGINMFDGLNAEKYAKGGSVGKRTRARRSLNNLDVDLSVDASGASDALAQFADDVDTVRGFFKDAGIKWTKALDTQTDAVRQSARQYDAINATLSSARGNKASFASSVGSSLGKDVFGNGLAGFDAGVAANTNDFNTANSGLAAAIRNGLDGALLEALASSGDINALTQFGQLDAAGIAERERQFAAMQSAQSNFGNTAAGARYDGEIAKALADSARETKELRAELKKIGDRVERGARNGTHSGASQAGRDADTRTTQGTQTSGRGGGRRGGNR